MPILAIAEAAWLGILTSISPCPLATNIAAVSFIGKKVGSKRYVLLSGLLYTLGRMAAYLGLGIVLTAGIRSLSRSSVAMFLQSYAEKLLGPALIIVGMILVDLIRLRFSLSLGGRKVQQRAAGGGIWWAGVLGVLFALSFCPISAGLFFGRLVPLSAQHDSAFLLPLLFGVGTALPVIGFAFIMTFAAHYVGKAYNKLTQIERWARHITGAVFITVGIHFCLRSIFHLY